MERSSVGARMVTVRLSFRRCFVLARAICGVATRPRASMAHLPARRHDAAPAQTPRRAGLSTPSSARLAGVPAGLAGDRVRALVALRLAGRPAAAGRHPPAVLVGHVVAAIAAVLPG